MIYTISCRFFFQGFVTYLQYPQEEARSKITLCCRIQFTDCAVVRSIESNELVKT